MPDSFTPISDFGGMGLNVNKEIRVNEIHIPIDTTAKEYESAVMAASRRTGALRSMPVVILTGTGLLAAGVWCMSYFITAYSSAVLPVMMCILGPSFIVLYYLLARKAASTRASADYLFYSRLMKGAAVTFTADELVTHTPDLTLKEPYALMIECVETGSMFVLLRDRRRITVIPKRCITENPEEIHEFIRHIFARKIRKVKR